MSETKGLTRQQMADRMALAGLNSVCALLHLALPELKRLMAQDRYASHRCFWLRGEEAAEET